MCSGVAHLTPVELSFSNVNWTGIVIGLLYYTNTCILRNIAVNVPSTEFFRATPEQCLLVEHCSLFCLFKREIPRTLGTSPRKDGTGFLCHKNCSGRHHRAPAPPLTPLQSKKIHSPATVTSLPPLCSFLQVFSASLCGFSFRSL